MFHALVLVKKKVINEIFLSLTSEENDIASYLKLRAQKLNE